MKVREKEVKIIAGESENQMSERIDENVREIIEKPEKFGLEEQQEISARVSAMERKIVEYAKEEKTKPVIQKLFSLKEKLQELNPKYYEEHAPFWKKVLHLIPKGDELVRMIAEKYETVGQQVESIVLNLSDMKDVIIQDNLELEELEREIKEKTKQIESKVELGKKALKVLEEKLETTTDPVEKKKLEGKLFTLSSRIRDLQTLIQANYQFLISIQQTIQNNRALLDSIERTLTITRTVLTVGLAIRTALMNQKKAIEAVRSTQEFTADLLKSNAEAIKEQGAEVEKLYTEPILALEKLEEAYNTLISAINDFEEIRRKGIKVAQENIKKLEEMNRKIKEHVKE